MSIVFSLLALVGIIFIVRFYLKKNALKRVFKQRLRNIRKMDNKLVFIEETEYLCLFFPDLSQTWMENEIQKRYNKLYNDK